MQLTTTLRKPLAPPWLAHALQALSAELKDARYFQILYLAGFMLFGIMSLGWESDILKYSAVFTTCIAVQMIGAWWTGKPYSSVKSALISALGLCLLLKSGSVYVLMLAAALSIGSKFVIRFKGKHLFNPTNFGIIITLLLCNDAWISPGQWGREAIMMYFVGAAGLMIIFKVGRVDVSLAFLVTFALLEYTRMVAYQGWETEVWMHKLLNGSVLLFTFFMITDPVTTPNAKGARLVWAALVAALTFYLSSYMFVHTAPVWALFFISPLTVIFDTLFKGRQFKWINA
ncbi:MAG: RnfABCDGE type electron transport complex subunit D [Bacteroidota bacterium]|nr:RnfABCDGE type electron transport complex subunit D [Bacteroidota bacterium]